MRDLLTGASREEAPGRASSEAPASAATAQRSPLHVVESLNSLSVDIARAIDHDASIELWDRYRRGERDVFTRRLYTLKGQQTFDEIRRKYQTEANSAPPSTATATISRSCSRTSRATTATTSWRRPT